MFNTIKSKNEAIELLRNYTGPNPYILRVKRDVILLGKTSLLSEYAVEYIIKNNTTLPKAIGKIIPIADWFGEKLQTDYEIEFTPRKLQILMFLGETSSAYHCTIKYRQNMDPLEMFIPKRAVGNILVEDYHSIQVDFDRYDSLSMSRDANRKMKPHQKEAVQFLLHRKKCILADDMGLGKMEPISALIPTPYGFKKMGDIKKGDNVFGRDGQSHSVLETFPHKNKEIYKVTFSDGTSAECGLDHLWTVRTKNMVKRNQGWKVMSLKELIESGFQYNDKKRIENGLSGRNKYEIPICDAVEYTEKEYFINPYTLGILIGDGNLCNGGIHISIPDFEWETHERVKNTLIEGYELTVNRSSSCPRHNIVKESKNNKENAYMTEIERLGLNVKGNLKFIPEEYKLGSIKQRTDLLRGLMDSDGSIRKGNKIRFDTTSETLARDVQELVYSLGGTARLHRYDRTSTGKSIKYAVFIQIGINPFYLTRKAAKYSPTFKKYCSKYIVSAEYARNEDAQCIMVDSEDHTYLTGRNYIVTHNTTTLAVAALEGNFDSVVIICPASLKTNWKRELMWYVPEKDITIIESFNGKTKSELEKMLGYAEGRSGLTADELKKEAESRGKWENNRFVIVNYDILDEFYEIPKTRSKENIEKAALNSPLLQYILNRKSLIIVDEAHRLSNNTSIRYKIIRDLIKRGNPHSVYLATGTPITNNPQNLYCVLQLIEDTVTGDWQYYMDRYCGAMKIPAKGEKERCTNNFLRMKGKQTWYDLTQGEKDALKEYIRNNARHITIAKDGTNLDELKYRISHLYLRRTKEDIADNLPQKTVHEIFYTFDMAQEMEYAKLWEEYETAQLEADPTKEINKELLEGAIYRKYCSNQMVPNTIEMADKFIANGEKVIIACCYDEELYTLRDYYGDRCVIYNGKMSGKEKDAAQKAFLEDPNKMVFIGNLVAASVGLTLIVSKYIIFNSFSYTSAENRQMEDRIYRIGQKRDVDIYYQMFNNTRTVDVWNICLRKDLIANTLIKKESEK